MTEVAKRHRVSEPLIYTLHKKIDDMSTNNMKRLNQLAHENNRLKKIVAEQDLEIEVQKDSGAM